MNKLGCVNDSWWNRDYRYRIPLNLLNPLNTVRTDEPSRTRVEFELVRPHLSSLRVVDNTGQEIPSQLSKEDRDNSNNTIRACTLDFLANLNDAKSRYYLYFDTSARDRPEYQGIRQAGPTFEDAFRRFDTGKYVIELCCGTGAGDASGKWGIKYFEEKRQGQNLLHAGQNALGGVYGPFFTLENGLVNPTSHMRISAEVVEEGPVVCRYAFEGIVPPGLRPELHNKSLRVLWSFYFRSAWFERSYLLDDYETVIDGKTVTNRITVGDELESGPGSLAVSTYRHYGETSYREGKWYGYVLLRHIELLRRKHPHVIEHALAKLNIDLQQEPSSWHWDKFWRLFSVREGVLPEELLRNELGEVLSETHREVWDDASHTKVHYTADAIEVNAKLDQTIFPLNAQKSFVAQPGSGYGFLYYVNTVVPRMEIVQRRASGWANWGTNGENEFPELMSGSTICTAYGKFTDWRSELDKMESRVAVAIGPTERCG